MGEPDAFERLWTPHRIVYIKGENKPATDAEVDCPFCRIPQMDDAEGLVVRRGDVAYAVLNLYPYTAGHLLICPFRHVADYTDLTDEETAEVAELTKQAMVAMRSLDEPARLQPGHQPGQHRRRRHRRAPAPARGPALGRRLQLPARHRAHQDDPAAARRDPRACWPLRGSTRTEEG